MIQVASSGFRELGRIRENDSQRLRKKRGKKKINSLVEKAKGYVKEKSVAPAESTFSQILAMDPENLDVPSLKMELNPKKEEERKALEKALKRVRKKGS